MTAAAAIAIAPFKAAALTAAGPVPDSPAQVIVSPAQPAVLYAALGQAPAQEIASPLAPVSIQPPGSMLLDPPASVTIPGGTT